MIKNRFAAIFLILSLCILSLSARADWINLTGAQTTASIAEINVLDDHIRLMLEGQRIDPDAFTATAVR